MEYVLRFIVGGLAVSAFSVLGDVFRPKSFAGLFGAAPSIALAALGIALWHHSSDYVAVEGRSMILGALALAVYSVCVCHLMMRFQLSALPATSMALGVWLAVALGSKYLVSKWAALRQSTPHEYVIRFVLGGVATVLTGVIAKAFGPATGGLFLAFPAIFCASAILVEKHQRERRERHGFKGAVRGREAAALDAAGAVQGSIGLASFGLAIWLLIPLSASAAFCAASIVWASMSVMGWLIRRKWRLVGRPKAALQHHRSP